MPAASAGSTTPGGAAAPFTGQTRLAGVKRVVVVMDHTNKVGESTVLKACSLPLTGKAVVSRIISNLGVLDVVKGGLKIVELAEGVSDAELRAATEATIID